MRTEVRTTNADMDDIRNRFAAVTAPLAAAHTLDQLTESRLLGAYRCGDCGPVNLCCAQCRVQCGPFFCEIDDGTTKKILNPRWKGVRLPELQECTEDGFV